MPRDSYVIAMLLRRRQPLLRRRQPLLRRRQQLLRRRQQVLRHRQQLLYNVSCRRTLKGYTTFFNGKMSININTVILGKHISSDFGREPKNRREITVGHVGRL